MMVRCFIIGISLLNKINDIFNILKEEKSHINYFLIKELWSIQGGKNFENALKTDCLETEDCECHKMCSTLKRHINRSEIDYYRQKNTNSSPHDILVNELFQVLHFYNSNKDK